MGDLQRRATMQDFRNFPLHMTGELWNLVEGTDTTVSQLRKIEMLCTYLVNSLGLRHASEPTQSVMVALVCRRADAAQQSALLQTMKAVLKTTTTRPNRQEGHCLVTYIWSSCLRAKISFLLPTGLTWQLWLSCLYRLVWAWMRSGCRRAQRRWGIEISSLSSSPRGFHHTPGERRMSPLASADSSPDVTTGCSYICRAWNLPKAVSRTDASGWLVPMILWQWMPCKTCTSQHSLALKAQKIFVCVDFTSIRLKTVSICTCLKT